MPLRFAEGFDPAAVQAMMAAFDQACDRLGLANARCADGAPGIGQRSSGAHRRARPRKASRYGVTVARARVISASSGRRRSRAAARPVAPQGNLEPGASVSIAMLHWHWHWNRDPQPTCDHPGLKGRRGRCPDCGSSVWYYKPRPFTPSERAVQRAVEISRRPGSGLLPRG
jgi:hypothetical protein